jgi:hypothetical protein
LLDGYTSVDEGLEERRWRQTVGESVETSVIDPQREDLD